MTRIRPTALCGTLLLAVSLLLVAGDRTATADSTNAGRLLAEIERPIGCFGERTGVGVSMTPYGGWIFYTCQSSSGQGESALLARTGLDGSRSPELETRDASGSPIPMLAIAWDSSEDTHWGVSRVAAGSSAVNRACALWRIDTSRAVGEPGEEFFLATLAFTLDDARLCRRTGQAPLITGLAVDGTTGTVYVSDQDASLIRALTKSGAPAPNDPIPFQKMTRAYCTGGCRASGLAIGVNGLLMASAPSDPRLFLIDPAGPTVLTVFTSGSPRNWDLECGPMMYDATGAPLRTILSADFESSMIRVLQAPPDFCDPQDAAVRSPQVSPNSLTLGQDETGIVAVMFEAAIFGGGPGAYVTATIAGDIPSGRYRSNLRILAVPGDRCSFQAHDLIEIDRDVPCAEGDAAGSPSVGGFAVCYDGIDNDGDGLTDFQDVDCYGEINVIEFPLLLDHKFRRALRYVAVGGPCLAFNPPSGFHIRLSYHLDTNASNNSASPAFTATCN